MTPTLTPTPSPTPLTLKELISERDSLQDKITEAVRTGERDTLGELQRAMANLDDSIEKQARSDFGEELRINADPSTQPDSRLQQDSCPQHKAEGNPDPGVNYRDGDGLTPILRFAKWAAEHEFGSSERSKCLGEIEGLLSRNGIQGVPLDTREDQREGYGFELGVRDKAGHRLNDFQDIAYGIIDLSVRDADGKTTCDYATAAIEGYDSSLYESLRDAICRAE